MQRRSFLAALFAAPAVVKAACSPSLEIKVGINPMLFLDIEGLIPHLEGAIATGLLSDEEAASTLADFVESKLPVYMEILNA